MVTGSRGQLGRCLVRALSEPSTAAGDELVAAFSHAELDIADAGAVARALASLPGGAPEVLVNAAAYNQVDRCESDGRDEAFRVNGLGPGVLARACEAAGARLVHVSTDYVLDGDGTAPIPENATPAPHTVYGHSKLLGETRVREASSTALVVRTSWVFGPGKNFVGAILRQARLRRTGEASGPLRVVDDQHGCPTYAADLAAGIRAAGRGDGGAERAGRRLPPLERPRSRRRGRTHLVGLRPCRARRPGLRRPRDRPCDHRPDRGAGAAPRLLGARLRAGRRAGRPASQLARGPRRLLRLSRSPCHAPAERSRRAARRDPPMTTVDRSHIRNFCIIAHIDHGKSTLADRLLDATHALTRAREEGAVPRQHGPRARARHHDQGPDRAHALPGRRRQRLRAEPDRHARPRRLLLRGLAGPAACEGALLVVDAAQGIEAQTLANAYLAVDANLEIIPVLNKIDLPAADPERVAQEIEDIVGLDATDVLPVSAKDGTGHRRAARGDRRPRAAAEGRSRGARAGAGLRLLVRPLRGRGAARARDGRTAYGASERSAS